MVSTPLRAYSIMELSLDGRFIREHSHYSHPDGSETDSYGPWQAVSTPQEELSAIERAFEELMSTMLTTDSIWKTEGLAACRTSVRSKGEEYMLTLEIRKTESKG